YGRVPAIGICHLISAIAGTAIIFFSHNFIVVLISRAFMGCVVLSQGMFAVVLVMEFVGIDGRMIISTLFLFSYSITATILPCVAYYIDNWKILSIMTSAPLALQNICYTGANLHAANVSKRPFIMLSVNSGLDVIATFFSNKFSNTYGRKITTIVSCLLAATAYISAAIVPLFTDNKNKDLDNTFGLYIEMAVLLLGRLTFTCGYNVQFIYAAEVYPTVIRSRALAVRLAVGSIGNMISPQIVKLSEINEQIPLIIFGLCALMASVLMVKLPETLDKPLPETLEDGDTFGKKTKSKPKNVNMRRRSTLIAVCMATVEIPLNYDTNGITNGTIPNSIELKVNVYFPQTTFPDWVTRPNSLMFTSMTVPFVMTPNDVYIGELGFFFTPIIGKLKVALNSGCVTCAVLNLRAIGRIKRSNLGGFRVKPSPTKHTFVTIRFQHFFLRLPVFMALKETIIGHVNDSQWTHRMGAYLKTSISDTALTLGMGTSHLPAFSFR
ncbi:unnamed protein product, partial [Oppiella nova]